MKVRRNTKLLVEPPSSATGDIAFNLIVFFLVCASVQPDSGRKQEIPNSEQVEKEQRTENVEVMLKRRVVLINGDPVPQDRFVEMLRSKLGSSTKPEERIVVVNSDDDVPYWLWIQVTEGVEEAGGTITLQLEEERTVQLPG